MRILVSYVFRSVTLCSSRGSLVLAHATLLVATNAKRNVAQGGAAVVRLVVREGSLIVSLLIGQYPTFSLIVYLPPVYFAGIVAAQASYAVVSQSSSPFAFFVSVPFSALNCSDTNIKLNTFVTTVGPPRSYL